MTIRRPTTTRAKALALGAGALVLRPGSARAQDSGSAALAALVREANREGRLLATVQSSWGRAMLPDLASAFRKRFGLTFDVSITPTASATQFPLEIAATRAGNPPTYDVMQGDDAETMQLTGGGGVQAIPNWEQLLAAINPEVAARKVSPSQVSRDPFKGTSFLYMANVKVLAYNPNRIKETELPKLHSDLRNAKYKGQFAQPPWTAHWEVAPEVLKGQGRDKHLELVREVGKNTGAVLFENTAVARVILGQYAFALAQDAYIRTTQMRDNKAPLAWVFFQDYNELNQVYYSVRTRAPHPAAAALWTLWMTTPEAEAIWQPDVQAFVPYGSSSIDVTTRTVMKTYRAPVIGYLDNAQTVELLKWQQTPDGAKYFAAIAKAIRGE
jgi:ABC-type Fe3+ transport system substrate-binding protein